MFKKKYKDILCSNQIIFILLKSSQSVDMESEIAFFNLGLQAQNYSKKKAKNQNLNSHCSSRQLEKNFKTFCSLDMLNLFLVLLC
jgi:hypothetical protein